VTAANAAQVIGAGATALVAGTAVFGDGPARYAANIARLRCG
jgi:ribulose-phosphate 3-epimerase